METIETIIKKYLFEMEERIFDADILFNEIKITETERNAAFKELFQLVKENQITKLASGVYAKNTISRITKKEKVVSERDIVNYYTKNDSGFTVAYDLYNRANISTQISKKKIILSSQLKQETKTIKSVTINKVNIEINTKTKLIIETLEIIENSDKIQDFNDVGFINYINKNIGKYDEKSIFEVINNLIYKKSSLDNFFKIIERTKNNRILTNDQL